jgi:MarR family transcriptional regulator, organic hydroperoxide resistance regulator
MRATPRELTPHAEAWTLLQRLMRAQRGRMSAIGQEFGLAPAQVLALGTLEPGRPCPMSELAGALRCDNSNVTGIVDRLEARGLVRRRPAEHDRRIKMLEVTDEGEALRERLRDRLVEPPEALRGLGEEDARALRDLLRRALDGP